jgi:hypothetical protein
VYDRRKSGQIGRGTEARDRPNRRVICGHRHAAERGGLAVLKALAARPSAAVVRVIHVTNRLFKAGNTAGFSKNQVALAWCRINAVATREGSDLFGQWNWRLGVGAIARWSRSKMSKVSKIAGPLRVQSLLTCCDLCARDRYIAKVRENRASSENCEIPRNMRYREKRMQLAPTPKSPNHSAAATDDQFSIRGRALGQQLPARSTTPAT